MDFKELADRLGLEEDEFIELAELFVETGSSDIRQLQSAVEQQDVLEVVKKSHSIKGSSGNLGFLEIFGVAKDIEMNARENTLDGAAGAAVVIKEKINQIAKAINEKNTKG